MQAEWKGLIATALIVAAPAAQHGDFRLRTQWNGMFSRHHAAPAGLPSIGTLTAVFVDASSRRQISP